MSRRINFTFSINAYCFVPRTPLFDLLAWNRTVGASLSRALLRELGCVAREKLRFLISQNYLKYSECDHIAIKYFSV